MLHFSAAECGGEGGKPGPCKESHSEGTHHGVGGKPHPEDTKVVNDRIGTKSGKLSPHQEQVHADLQSIAGELHVHSGGYGSNVHNHGKVGVLVSTIVLPTAEKDTGKKIDRLKEYADRHGYAVDVTIIPASGDVKERTRVKFSTPKEPMNDRQKDAMRMRNAAVAGDDTAMHALADKLQEMGAPFGEKLAKEISRGNGREAIKEHEDSYGSVLSKGGKLGMGGRSGSHTESASRRRWRATEDCSCNSGSCSELRVDREKGIIYNVLVLGRKARNKRRYTVEACEDAVKRRIYEGLQVYIGPHKRSRFAKRSPREHAGELRGVYHAKDGLRAREFHVNRESEGGKLVLEIAERFSTSFGLSHHADLAGYEEDGERIITRILEVNVADVVKDPGTTDGVFEEVGEEGEIAGMEPTAPDAEGGGGWAGAIKDLIAAIHDDDSIEDDVKVKATKKAMDLKKMLKGEDDSEDDPEPEPEAPGEESVDVKELEDRIAKRVIKEMRKAAPAAQPKQRPKSTARVEGKEEATPKAKPKVPKTREEVHAAYEVED